MGEDAWLEAAYEDRFTPDVEEVEDVPDDDGTDYCMTCEAVTRWSGETCACCGRVWGYEGGTCRHQH